MKTLTLIIAVAALGGAAYGQQAGSLEWLEQRNLERQLAAQQEQLDELAAHQRRACYENPIPLPDPFVEQERMRCQRNEWFREQELQRQINRENQLRLFIEDCE
jgi:hypothetical protein